MEEGKDIMTQINNYRNENPAIEISLVDMLFDRNKRECIYNQYDKNYLSTQEEDEIFEDMYNETEECEWHEISDIFSKAINRQNMNKNDVEKMIVETQNEVRRK